MLPQKWEWYQDLVQINCVLPAKEQQTMRQSCFVLPRWWCRRTRSPHCGPLGAGSTATHGQENLLHGSFWGLSHPSHEL